MTDPKDIFPAPPPTTEYAFGPFPTEPTDMGAYDAAVTPSEEWVDQQFPDTDKGVTG